MDIVRGGGVIYAPIVPDSQIIDVLPLQVQAHLQVVILDNQLHEPIEKMLRLLLAQSVDSLHVIADSENRLPARHRVGANYGMDRLKDLANILGRTTLCGPDLDTVFLGGSIKQRLRVVSRQGIEEASQSWRDAVVELVARGPKSV